MKKEEKIKMIMLIAGKLQRSYVYEDEKSQLLFDSKNLSYDSYIEFYDEHINKIHDLMVDFKIIEGLIDKIETKYKKFIKLLKNNNIDLRKCYMLTFNNEILKLLKCEYFRLQDKDITPFMKDVEDKLMAIDAVHEVFLLEINTFNLLQKFASKTKKCYRFVTGNQKFIIKNGYCYKHISDNKCQSLNLLGVLEFANGLGFEDYKELTNIVLTLVKIEIRLKHTLVERNFNSYFKDYYTLDGLNNIHEKIRTVCCDTPINLPKELKEFMEEF